MNFQSIINDLKKYGRTDIMSGFIVFLIALPLCVGIAVASGAPPTSGLIAGIIGGIVASIFGGSYVTINGPAAGLIVIVLGAIDGLGDGNNLLGFKRMLACLVVVGVLQILMGIWKKGFLGRLFPASVIHGMMTAIGIIIISKQIYILTGATPHSKTPWELILEIPNGIASLNPEIFLIGGSAMLVLIFFQISKWKFMKKLPAPLFAVLIGILLEEFFHLRTNQVYTFMGTEYTVGPKFLVQIPDSLSSAIIFPDFSVINRFEFWFHTGMIFFIASLESLLSAQAVDQLDPLQRRTDMDKELIGKGIANTLLGAIGGFPIIAEIVRSKANIENGGRSIWSNFFHGIFLLVFLLLIPDLLRLIPMASLAAILVLIGWRLASHKEFIHIYKKGPEQLIVFITTIAFTLVVDLLFGILMGILVKILIQVISGVNVKQIFTLDWSYSNKESWTIRSPLLFSNSFGFLKSLEEESQNGNNKFTLDFNQCNYIDHTSMEAIYAIINRCEQSGVNFDIIWGNLNQNTEYKTSVRRHSK
ncbi:SulP family inorganic anion transporter [Leptospira sp. GIMC2001]|uniref:SulP family inorganic anion transporter n=1 Tax=Leptospira sp. GIMC2001 TaxID=1513297 RepID=UPI00234A05F4|nr:SulP family inorganic anion transporter [Leptospira sp. GIMC2001]WCL48837.1 SulP family inorganic anion transporter [Leptospira sp. GIMC2001]